jgi:hypothetical protein
LYERGFSPIEFLKPDELEAVMEQIREKENNIERIGDKSIFHVYFMPNAFIYFNNII